MKKTLLLTLATVLTAVLFVSSSYGQFRIKSGSYAITKPPFTIANNVTITDGVTTSFITVDSISGTIDALNKYGVESGGTVEFKFADNYQETATTTIFGGSYTPGNYTLGGGPANVGDPSSALFSTSYNAIIFKHIGTGTNPVLTAKAGGSGTNDYMIRFLGVDKVTFDGIDLKENTSNTTNTTRMEWGYYLLTGTTGNQYNTIKNCKITMARDNYLSIGIYQNNLSASSGAENSYNTFDSVIVWNSYQGIHLSGISSSFPDVGCKITKCLIGDPGTVGDIGLLASSGTSTGRPTTGIWVDYQSGFTIRTSVVNNVSYNGSGSASAFPCGIYITNCSGTSTVSENNISAIKSSVSGSVPSGIYLTGASSSGTTYIHTNFISDVSISAGSTTSLRCNAIAIGKTDNNGTAGAGNVKIYQNSVSMFGSIPCNATVLYVNGSSMNVEAVNNIFKWNNLTASVSSARTFYGLYIASGTVNSSYNMFSVGTNTTYSLYTLSSGTYTNGGGSVTAVPIFLSNTDLHLNPSNHNANYVGTNTITTPTITTDIDTISYKSLPYCTFFSPTDPLIYPLKGADQYSNISGIIISANQPADSLVQQGSSNQILGSMIFTVQGATSYNFTGITFNTAGTFATSSTTDFGYFRLFIGTSSTFSPSTSTLLGTITNSPATTGGALAFTSFTPYTLAAGGSFYLFLTDSVGLSAVPGKNISIATTAFSNILFSGTPPLFGTNPVAASGSQIVAQFFYNFANSDITQTASWHEKVSGSNLPPNNFTDNNQVFVFEYNTGSTMTQPWIVGGTNTKIFVGQDPGSKLGFATFEARFPVFTTGSVVVDVRDSGILKFQSGYVSATKLGTLSLGSATTHGSTVEYGDSSTAFSKDTIINADYCHLVLSQTVAGGTRYFNYGNVNVARTFTPGGFTGATRGQITFNGSVVAQTIPTGFNFWRLRTNNTVGAVTLAGDVNVDSLLRFTTTLTIGAGQKITLGALGWVTNTDGGTGILNVNGSLVNNNPADTVFQGKLNTYNPNIVFGANSTYDLNANLTGTPVARRGQIPPATWAASSTINITNVTMTTANDIVWGEPSAVGYGNISFDAPALGVDGYRLFGGVTHVGSGSANSPWVVTMQGNLTLNRSGTSPVRIVDLGAGTSVQSTIMNVAGTYNQSNGIYRLYNSNGGATGGRMDLNVIGDITLSTGTQLILTGSSVTSSIAFGRVYTAGNFTANPGTSVLAQGTAAPSAVITFTKNGNQTLTTSGATFSGDINYTVNATSNTKLGTTSNLTVNNNAYINLLTGGIFDIAANNTLTINGTINNLGTVQTGTFSGTSTSDLVLGGSIALDTIYFTSGNAVLKNLTLTRTSPGTIRVGNAPVTDLTLHGNLTIGDATNLNDTLDMRTNAIIAGSSFTATNIHTSGTLKTANITSTPLPATKTWGGLVWYYSTSAQTMVDGDFYYLNGTNGSRTLSSTGTIGVSGPAPTVAFKPGSGAYIVTNSTVDFNGSSANQTCINTPFTFYNLGFKNGGTKTIGDTMFVQSVLTLNGATTTLELAAKNIVMRSTSTLTSSVAAITSGTISYSGSGLFVIERNTGNLRSWRLLTAPISNSPGQSIKNSWMEGSTNVTTGVAYATAILPPYDNVDGYGTHISGPLGVGFDQTPLNNYSIKYYDRTPPAGSRLWTGAGATPITPAALITREEGWMLFIRGDRNYNILTTTAGTTPIVTTLRTTGKIKTGTQATITPSGFQVVGNPYASAVEFSSVTKSTSTGTYTGDIYYVWDPRLNGTLGGWITCKRKSSGTGYSMTPVPASAGLDSLTGRIESGAAIMVNSANITSLNFKETDKTSANALVFRPVDSRFQSVLRTNLHVKNNDGSTEMLDGVMNMFNKGYSNTVDGADAIKLTNNAESFSIAVKDKLISVESRDELMDNDTIFFNFAQVKVRNYVLELAAENMTKNNLVGYLEDNFLKTKTRINSNGITKIEFNANRENQGSYAKDRFRIVFKKAVKYNVIKADVYSSDVQVEWKVADEFNISKYEVERSIDGENFTTIAVKQSVFGKEAEAGYTQLDEKVTPGEYYYRIKTITDLGMEVYSDAVKVQVIRWSDKMYVFPNPVTNNTIQLQLTNAPAGKYNTRLLNASGQVITSQVVVHAGGTATKTVIPSQALASGNYQMEVIGPDKKRSVIKVMVSNK